MNASSKLNSSLLVLAGAMLLLVSGSAKAAAIIGWGHGATNDTVYFQFSTDVPPDAYRAVVRQPGVGVVAASPVRHVHYASSGFADSVTGLSPSTNYVLVIRIRWVHGGGWTTAWVQPFMTAP